MQLQRMPYDALPLALREDVMRQIGDYCVAIGRMRNDDPNTFRLIGSGTCVQRGAAIGVLTAHHCLHECSPPVQLGPPGNDRLYFFAKGDRRYQYEQHELLEHQLGRPGYPERDGPDLTFIQFPPGSSLSAVSSLWNLDRNPDALRRDYCMDFAGIIHAGYPAVRNQPLIQGKHVHVPLNLFGGMGGLLQEDLETRGEWDYINTRCDYRAFPHLPESFGGVSGGGIWSVLFRSNSAGERVLHGFALVGVSFHEEIFPGLHGTLRGHGVESIYRRAWCDWTPRGA